ncbi:MAG: hydroxymethylglutaryl-CoA reductase, degradative [Bacteroidota bacterium]
MSIIINEPVPNLKPESRTSKHKNMRTRTIKGFSKLSKEEKMQWVAEHFFEDMATVVEDWRGFWHRDKDLQNTLDGFSENTLSNFPIPFGVAPNFIINGRAYAIPMAIEESSVVAAASYAAKIWMARGGFHAEVVNTIKIGQVHFLWKGEPSHLKAQFEKLKAKLRAEAKGITERMDQRGGGILDIELINMSDQEPRYHQLKVSFETCDSMGANFINSVLEQFAATLKNEFPAQVEIIMSILSNYTPDCSVKAWAECPIADLEGICKEHSAVTFANKFYRAVRIAEIDPYRATTHNKGIYNGIDAVVLATGNDFRAIEACGHTYAARNGQYSSLSHCSLENGMFRFELEVPMAVGTVGGLTKLHPLAKRSLQMLGQPSAKELMKIIAVVGLAQNFAAVRSLITTGIQQGHMKMHLQNILQHFNAHNGEVEATIKYFEDKKVSFNGVRLFLEELRQEK